MILKKNARNKKKNGSPKEMAGNKNKMIGGIPAKKINQSRINQENKKNG